MSRTIEEFPGEKPVPPLSYGLIVVIALGLVVFLLHEMISYGTSFGERDLYRMTVALIDSAQNGTPLNNPLSYGYSASIGFYWYLAALYEASGGPYAMATLSNSLNVAWSWMALLCLAAIANRLAGLRAAIASIAFGLLAPVWWFGSLYAHPVWPAIALFLAALALAVHRDEFRRPWLADLLQFACLAGAFAFRFDVVLMAPMFLGIGLTGLRAYRAAFLRNVVIGLVAVLAARGLYLLGAPAVSSELETSALDLFLRDHTPHRFVRYFIPANITLVQSLNPFTAAGVLCGAAVLIARRQLQLLMLTVPVIVFSYLFWVPNASPRHFLYLMPAMFLVAASVWGRGAREGPRIDGFEAALFLSAALVGVATLRDDRVLFVLAAVPMAGAAVLEGFRLWQAGSGRRGAVYGLGALFAAGFAVAAFDSPRWALENKYPRERALMLEAQADLFEPYIGEAPNLHIIGDTYPALAELMRRHKGASGVTMTERTFLKGEGHTRIWLELRLDERVAAFYAQGWDIDQALKSTALRLSGEPGTVLVPEANRARAEAYFDGQESEVRVIGY